MKNWINYNLEFLKALNSPFKGLKLKWYFGEITKGTPYFLPRKWVRCNMNDALKAWDKLGEASQLAFERTKGKEKYLSDYIKSYTKPIPIKYFHWYFTTLGWKTKWDDYRFEWNPSLSIVIFGKQLFIEILPNVEEDILRYDVYWEAWLNYNYDTDKTKTKKERFLELIEKHSCTWTGSKNGEETSTDYYYSILKDKYVKLYKIVKWKLWKEK